MSNRESLACRFGEKDATGTQVYLSVEQSPEMCRANFNRDGRTEAAGGSRRRFSFSAVGTSASISCAAVDAIFSRSSYFQKDCDMSVRFPSRVGLAAFIVALSFSHSGTSSAKADPQSSDSDSRRQSQRLESGEIHLNASRVYIFVDKKGFGHQHGVAGRLSEGRLRVADKSAGRMVFDMRSFAADAPEARRYVGLEEDTDEKTQHDVTATMQGPDVLDVDRYSTAVFTVESMRRIEAKESKKEQYRLDGQFQLHGATRRLQFVAEGTSEKGYLHLKGSFPLRQTEYKIRPFRKALGAVGVADVLTVYGDLWIKR